MQRLSGWDVLMLASETPNVHQHTLKVAVVDTRSFEGVPNFDAFREVLRARLPVLEPMHYQLVTTPWHLHRPVWHEDAELDLDYHLQRLQWPDTGATPEHGEAAFAPPRMRDVMRFAAHDRAARIRTLPLAVRRRRRRLPAAAPRATASDKSGSGRPVRPATDLPQPQAHASGRFTGTTDRVIPSATRDSPSICPAA